MAIVISSDEIKKTLPNYSPNKAEDFHRESTIRADKQFYSCLKTAKAKDVILMGGGAASGKTEFLETQLSNNSSDSLIFDTTLSSKEGSRIKIERILKAGKIPILYFVLPDDIKRAYIAFLHRDRKFSDEHFFRTHSGSRSTLLWVAQKFENLKINIVESSYTQQQTLQFAGIIFPNRSSQIDYIKQIQVSETDIIKIVTEN